MFTLTIETDNAAFRGYAGRQEIARLLAEVIEIVEDVDDGTLRDINGNTVGRWELTR